MQRLLLCSGKVYYELVKERARLGLEGRVAIVRVEQVRAPADFSRLLSSLPLLRRFLPSPTTW